MNLSLTPLNEAYVTPKIKKHQSTNVYNETSHQKELLKKSNMEINNGVPTGYTGEPTESSVLQEPQVHESNTPRVESNATKTISVSITDPELVEILDDYKVENVERVIKKEFFKNRHHTKKRVEPFTGNISFKDVCNIDSNSLIMYILLAILLIDILIRLRY